MTSRSLVLIIVTTLMIASGCGAPAIPDGWVTIPRPSDDEMNCANYQGAWEVDIVGGSLRITPSEPAPPVVNDREPPSIDDIQDPESDRRIDHLIAMNDGWLVGIEGVEGGGVWWIGRGDTTERSNIVEGNVVGLERVSEGVLIFVGLARQATDRGGVLLAARSDDGRWNVDDLANLGSMPLAYSRESSSTFIVLDGNGLRRVHIDSGRIEGLVEVSLGILYPTSMAITRSGGGVVFVGMRHGVARFDLSTNRPTHDWLVRQQCPHLRRLSDWECYCVSGTSDENPDGEPNTFILP